MAETQKKFDTELGTENPALYRELCEPFPSPNDAEQAVQAFAAELYDLRAKHRIRDLLIVVSATVKYPSEEEGEVSCVIHFGDELKSENMAAYGLGFLQSQRQERTAKTLASAVNAVGKGRNRK